MSAILLAAWSVLKGLGGGFLDWLHKLLPPETMCKLAQFAVVMVLGWLACFVFYGVPALKADKAALADARVELAALQAAQAAGNQIAADQAAKDQNLAWQAGYDAGKSAQAIVATLSPTILKVPYAISREADAACPVPWGFVRLWDALSTGADLDAVRARVAPGEPDAATSDVTLSQIVALYGNAAVRFHQNADQLNRLEGFERAAGK